MRSKLTPDEQKRAVRDRMIWTDDQITIVPPRKKEVATGSLRVVFAQLRAYLQRQRGTLAETSNTAKQYRLEGAVGPSTVAAWGGRAKKPTTPVAWVVLGKTYVSYHLMGMYGNRQLLATLSNELRDRMQGKTCFNFSSIDKTLFKELERVTERSIVAFRKTGFIL